MAIERSKIHEAGADRHVGRWLLANQRAVEAIQVQGYDPSKPEMKDVVPLIVLKVLDGQMVDQGLYWNKENRAWETPMELSARKPPTSQH